MHFTKERARTQGIHSFLMEVWSHKDEQKRDGN